MTTIVKELDFATAADGVWNGVRSVATPHADLAPGFVVEATLDGDDARILTFVNGAVARELIVDVDDRARRLAYAVVESPLGLTHHHATMQVTERDDGGSHMTWVVDLLPDSAAEALDQMMDAGAEAMTRNFSPG